MYSKTHIILGYLYICLGVEPSITSSASRSTLRVARQSCRLPQQPIFGKWTFYEGTAHPGPGDLLVPPGTILELSCQDNYRLDGEESSACIRGKWKPKIGQCLRTCPIIKNTPFMTVACTFNEKSVDNCTNAVDGTIARFTCAAFYEGTEKNPHRLCSNGSWGSIPECVPVCGEKSSDPRLIVGGTTAKPGGYPWQIALYNTSDKILLCGGSLVNERVVVTAAHCVTDPTGELLSKELFIVAAGKYFRKYDNREDFNKAQFSPITEMYVPRQYKGDRQNYVGDIAVLVTEKTFLLSHRILPVCVDWGLTLLQNLLNSTTVPHGYVTGWGFTAEYKNVSEELKVLKVPIVDEGECTRRLPVSDLKLLTDDKLCAGFVNSSASACRGDSGGGLVYEFDDRYYLLGVVSVAPQHQTENGGCNSQLYTLYTNVSYHTASFILDKERRFRPSAFGDLECNYDPNNCAIPSPTAPTPEVITKSPVEVEDNCTIPPHPEFGTWSVFGQPSDDIQPGETVVPGTSLTVQCDDNYKLEGTKISVCFNATWTSWGRCSIKKLFCPPILSTQNMKVTCIDENAETKNCLNATDGTLVKFECAPYYEQTGLTRRHPHVCQNGTWNQPTPNCVPVCGRNNAEDPDNYPWNVDILCENFFPNCKRECGGSLVSQTLVVTAANCVSRPIVCDNYTPKIPTRWRVAAGKSATYNHTQYSRVQDIHMSHPDYDFKNLSSDGDIALVVLQDPFKIAANLQPVCIDFFKTFETPSSGYEFIHLPILSKSTTLRLGDYIHVTTFTNSECYEKFPIEKKVILSYDKFCVLPTFWYRGTSRKVPFGLLAKIGSKRGSGIFKKIDDRYYIIGILNFFRNVEENPKQVVVIYTMVSKHVNNFIVPQFFKHKTE